MAIGGSAINARAINAADSLPTIVGTASVTLGALAVAASGTTTVVGAAAVKLGGLAVGASGTTTIVGTAAVTLGALAVAANGTTTIVGTATVTLGGLAVAATGTTTIVGSGAVTLGPLAVGAAGTITITGTASITLGPLSVNATGEIILDVHGDATVTLGPLSVDAFGRVGIVPDASTRSIARVTIVDVASFRFTARHGARITITPVEGIYTMPSTVFDFLLDTSQTFNPDFDVAQKNDAGELVPYDGLQDVTMILSATAGFGTPIAPSLTRPSSERPGVPGRIHPEPAFSPEELRAELLPTYANRIIYLNLFRDGEIFFQSYRVLVRKDRVGP